MPTSPDPHLQQSRKTKSSGLHRPSLDARALYPDCNLADLYSESNITLNLLRAHQQNDRVVMEAYGFSVRDTTESSCVAALMKMYQDLVAKSL